MLEAILASFFKFYGLDWLATAAQLVSIYLIGEKQRSAFIWKMTATVFYLGFNFLIGSMPAAAMSVVFFAMQFRAWQKWGEDD
jgi:hypothetical protein